MPLDALTEDFERMVRAQLKALARQVNLQVPVNAEGERLRAQVAAQIRAVESTLKAKVPVDPEGAGEFRRKLAAQVAIAEKTVRANVKVDVDRGALGKLGSLIGLGGKAAATFGQLAGSATEMGGSVTKAVSSAAGSLAGLTSSAFSTLAPLAQAVAMAALMAAGLGLVAGAVLALGGAVTAAVAGLPVLLTALGAPIAAIALGFDGIKRAAEPLRDEVDALKTALSDTFERTLTPVFERLQGVFPILQAGLVGVAEATAGFASGLVDVVTSEAGLRNIEAALAGVGVFLNAALPGAQALLGALLNVAGTTPLYQILGDTIGGLAGRLAGFLNHITETGLLTESLVQLRDVMFGASGALGVLTEGALEFFTAAGPGLTTFFEGLEAAFGNIDFAALGVSFGQIFAAIGDGLKNVPPETWQNLADAVANFAGSIQSIVDSGAITTLVDLFADLVTGAGQLLQSITFLGFSIQGVLNLMKGDLDGAKASFQNAWTAMAGTAETSGADIAGATGRHSAAAAALMKQNLATMPPETARIANQSLQGLVGGLGPMPGAGGRIAGDTANRVGGGLRQAEPQARSAGVSAAAGLAAAIAGGRSGVISAAIGIAIAAWTAAKVALRIGSPSRLFMQLGDQVVAGFVLAMEGGQPQVRAAMTALARTATAQFDQTLTAGLAGASGTVTDSLAALNRTQARSKPHRGPGPGMVQAEDGSWVPKSFYDKAVTQPSQARLDWLAAQKQPPPPTQPPLAPDVLTAAIVAAFDQSELRFSGDNIAKIVNRTNLANARR